ncbi:MAG: EAL domain-containing protein [Gammaproteobacteria bacterium]|nr:EAL domain-containing protein [Gammaproteobacteria bacterium]
MSNVLDRAIGDEDLKATTPALKVLVIKDSEDDALLLIGQLRRAGYEVEGTCVADTDRLVAALHDGLWDIVLTDHDMRGFDSIEALRIVKAFDPDLPVIIVSGAIGEVYAVEAMRAGARDYVVKGDAARLIPAMERELEAARERRATKRMEMSVQHLADHDSLTGLLSRRAFERRIEHAFDTAREDGATHVLCHIDLDHFDAVNEAGGLQVGDVLLQSVSAQLRASLAERDAIARLGSDEFGLLLEHCTRDDGLAVARKLCCAIDGLRFDWQGESYRLSISVGAVVIDAASGSVAGILRSARLALGTAQREGGNRVRLATETDDSVVHRRQQMAWVARLNRALDDGRLELWGQPIIAVAGPGQPGAQGVEAQGVEAQGVEAQGVEAQRIEVLVRLRDEDGTVVAPGVFFPGAARYKLMSRIDRWVVEAALSWLEARPHGDTRLNINLSGQSLGDREFSRYLLDRLADEDSRAAPICFEVTETAAVANLTGARDIMQVLREKGYEFALDDFGSGFSSFTYLKALPVDYLKIDGSFVRDMDRSAVDTAMVRSINDIGHVLGMRTIAEFIESAPVLEQLRTLGIDYGQGYYICEPRPLDVVVE